MTELQSSGALHSLELSGAESDEERLRRIKLVLREADQHSALAVTGSFEGSVTDVEAYGELISLLLEAPLPIFALPLGPVGPRCLAFLLVADRVILGQDASMTGNWRESPGIAAILHHRFGPLPARRLLFEPSPDPVARLIECGLAARSTDPLADTRKIAESLTGDFGRRLKRTLRASAELPLREALIFDLWFARDQQASVS